MDYIEHYRQVDNHMLGNLAPLNFHLLLLQVG